MVRDRQSLVYSLGVRRGTSSWTAVLGWTVTIVVTAAAVYGLVLASRSNTSGNAGKVNLAPVSAADWTKGGKNSAVTLVEYADFQCPACGTYYPIVQQVTEKYGNRILYAYREFPLTQIHKNGGLAARAAEAAGVQGKFWEMYDALFQNQNAWAEAPDAESQMEAYAKSIGMDTTRWKSDRESAAVKDKIAADVAGANTALVDSTPTFFLNSKPLDATASVDSFSTALDAALAQSEINPANSSANTNTSTNANL